MGSEHRFRLRETVARLAAAASPILCLSLALATIGLLHSWRYAVDRSGQDYYQQPWAVPTARKHVGDRNIWEPEVRRSLARWLLDDVGGGSKRKVPHGKERQHRAAMLAHPPHRAQLAVAGTPFFFAVLAPLADESFAVAGRNYVRLLFILFTASVIVLSIHFGLGVPAGLLACGLLAAFFEPWRAELRVWNVNAVLLACAAAVLVCLDRGWTAAAGAIAALAAAFKPTLAAVLITSAVSIVMQRQWTRLLRFGAGVTLAALFSFVVGCLWIGRWDAWVLFVRSLEQLTGSSYAMASGNFGLGRWLLEHTGSGQTVPLALCAFLVLVGFGLMLERRRGRESESSASAVDRQAHAAAVSLGLILPLLTAPLAWLHYFVLLILPALSLLQPHFSGEARWLSIFRQLSGAASLAIMCGWPVWLPTPVADALSKPFVTNLACAVLLLGTFALLVRPRHPQTCRHAESGPVALDRDV